MNKTLYPQFDALWSLQANYKPRARRPFESGTEDIGGVEGLTGYGDG